MTISWLDRLLEKGEKNSRCYDFTQARPVRDMWWFRVTIALGVILCSAWFFLQVPG